MKPAKNGGGVTFAKGIIEKSFTKIVSPERIGGLVHGVGKASAEAPWLGDQMQAGLYRQKLVLNFAEELDAEQFGEVETKAVDVESSYKVLQTVDHETASGGRIGPEVVAATAVVCEATELVGCEI